MAGYLTTDDLLAIWKSVVDSEYSRPILQAGDGGGLEVYSQGWAQFERVSKAIHTTTQAMYIMPWSGQTSEPAGGAAFATVDLTIARSLEFHRPLVLGKGLVAAEEVAIDSSPEGPVEIETGRLYILTDTLVFHAGSSAEQVIGAQAERPGYGFNNPLPGTITKLDQIGSRIGNEEASVTVTGFGTPSVGNVPASALLVAGPHADVPVPEHVGQYVQFLAGSNQGRIFRVLAYSPPSGVNDGGTLQLALDATAHVTVTGGPGFEVGESIELTTAGPTIAGYGIVLKHSDGKLTYQLTSGVLGTSVEGLKSATTATVTSHLQSPVVTAESGTATWRIVDWAFDLGVTSTNEESPTGGRAAFLDALGKERAVYRSPGEPDDGYRLRVWTPVDVVSPNAIRRALNSSLGDGQWTFREAGITWPGVYSDVDAFDYRVATLAGAGAVSGVGFTLNEPVTLHLPTSGKILGRGYVGTMVGTKPSKIVWRAGDWIWETGATLLGEQSGSVWVVDSVATSLGWQDTRFRTLLSYRDFRGFFWVGVAPGNEGEFGCAFDAGIANAFDAKVPAGNFFDGFPVIWARRNMLAYNAIEAAKAGGVGFAMFVERIDLT